jgi:hypothetical protein
MKTPNEFTNSEEQVRFENEILKLKLETEMGAKGMYSNPNSDLPPEVENAWLKSIYDFEKEHNNPANKKTVLEHIGNPSYKLLEELLPEEVEPELERLFKQMNEHGLAINFVCKYEPAIIYNFLTMELFPYEVVHKQREGAMGIFSYEDFHPNIDYEIKRVTREFLEIFFEEEEYHNFNMIYINGTVHTKNDKTITSDECLFILREVQKAYPKRRLQNCEIKEVFFDNNKGKSVTEIVYTSDGLASQTVEVILEFSPDDYFYVINRITIPGILEI